MELRESITEKANNNIGSLCVFLKSVNNQDYLNEIHENIPQETLICPMSEKITYYVTKKPIQLCECGDMKKFIGFKQGWRTTCGKKKCINNSRKQTCVEKYGVDNPKKSKEIIKTEQENILKNWNGSHYMSNQRVKDKFKSTMMDKYGVEWAQQSDDIRKKSQETWINNINRDSIIKKKSETFKETYESNKDSINEKKNNTIIENWGSKKNFYEYRNEKIKQKSLKNFGVEHHLSDKHVIKKRVRKYIDNITNKIIERLPEHVKYVSRTNNKNNTDTMINIRCDECNEISNINRQYLKFRLDNNKTPCLNCLPILNGKSNYELEVVEFIKTIYDKEIITNSRYVIDGELDIYLPDVDLAFEFNGLYWHSELYKDKMYHINKTNMCLESNIQLMHIWEDDWRFKQDIIKSIILNKLNLSKKIYARKCDIEVLNDNKEIRDFLNANHIQGFVGSKFKIGLRYKGELVSIMTFGSLRKSLNSKGNSEEWELLRFCNKSKISVIGAASRLLKNFIKMNQVSKIISYSDTSRSLGDMYEKLGFEFIHQTTPNYYWIIDGIRKHRFNYRKDKLVKEGADATKTEIEIMNSRGFYRIFDCGSKKWSLSPLIFECSSIIDSKY